MICKPALRHLVLSMLLLAVGTMGCSLSAWAVESKPAPIHVPIRYALPQSVLEKPFMFAGEQVPLDRSDVQARIASQVNFLLLDARSVLADWLTEKNRYSWIIEELFRKDGVPLEFVFFAPVLSAVPRNSSRAAGAGVWFLETGCSSDEGMEMSDDSWRDDRMDLELSSRCFASRIKALRRELTGGSWLLAAAAYVTSLKTVQDAQLKWNSNSYWDIPLPQSAEQLVCRWIAFALISAHKAAYGLTFKPHSPIIFDQVTGIVLSKDLSVGEIARMTGDPPREILRINPKIKPSEPIFPHKVKGKPFAHTILVPKGKGVLLLDKLRNTGYLVPESIN
jgi:membrane-bound lytic murein transglycosylase D